MANQKRIGIIGAGFAGLSAASYLAQKGYNVSVFEKNDQVGGRNRQFEAEGFKFDMGPSWYWMPDVFDKFFKDFNQEVKDFYELEKLNPSFSIFFKDGEKMDIPSEVDDLRELFETKEKGAGKKFDSFMKDAEYKYEVGINDLVQKPAKSIWEFTNWKVISGVFKLSLFSSFKKFVRKYFSDPKLLSLMDFPVLFLGSAPENTPALYSLMNYGGLALGTWYPKGGMHQIVVGMEKMAKGLGVKFHYSSEVANINLDNSNKVTSVTVGEDTIELDAIVSAGDYAHMEQLLPSSVRNYTENYWDKKTFAPSSLLFYLGVDTKVEGIEHHNLFFDEDLDQHAEEIYNDPKWPSKPLFYVCNPSKSDSSVAPDGKENLFLLIPIAAGLEDTEELREKYFNIIMQRLEKRTGVNIRENILYKRSYCVKNFEEDYHAYKGNAYGLANTLPQTAMLKPKIYNKKVSNLFYAGQLTVPGPGMPPSIISGKLAANEIEKFFKN